MSRRAFVAALVLSLWAPLLLSAAAVQFYRAVYDSFYGGASLVIVKGPRTGEDLLEAEDRLLALAGDTLERYSSTRTVTPTKWASPLVAGRADGRDILIILLDESGAIAFDIFFQAPPSYDPAALYYLHGYPGKETVNLTLHTWNGDATIRLRAIEAPRETVEAVDRILGADLDYRFYSNGGGVALLLVSRTHSPVSLVNAARNTIPLKYIVGIRYLPEANLYDSARIALHGCLDKPALEVYAYLRAEYGDKNVTLLQTWTRQASRAAVPLLEVYLVASIGVVPSLLAAAILRRRWGETLGGGAGLAAWLLAAAVIGVWLVLWAPIIAGGTIKPAGGIAAASLLSLALFTVPGRRRESAGRKTRPVSIRA